MDVMVGIIGGDDDADEVLFHGLKEFPSKKVILVAPTGALKKVDQIKTDLAKFKIPVEMLDIKNPGSLEEVFSTINKIRDREQDNNVVINVDTDYMSSCLALSAAFVNGVQAIGIVNEQVMAYPIMKFSYYNALSDKKLKIMKELHKRGNYISFDELSKKVSMSLPLMSYHINGNLKSSGLNELGLVEIKEDGYRKEIRLNMLGRLLVKGQVDFEKTKKG